MKILVIVEANGEVLRQASRSAITLASQIADQNLGEVELVILGNEVTVAAQAASSYYDTFVLSDPALEFVTADLYGSVVASAIKQRNPDLVIAASTSQGKDCIARAAAEIGGTMVSDVIGFKKLNNDIIWQRTMHAGSVRAWVTCHGTPVVVTALPSAFDPAIGTSEGSITELELNINTLPSTIQFESISTKKSSRPDVTEASIIVSGGRAFKTADDYERLIGGLADKLGGGTGSSRAAVDAGIAPNENQIGQTGKIVAPDLYMGIGISGAVQHLAGMKNSKIIVAINTDDEAPLLDYADFALIADAYDVIPEMINKI